MPRSRSEQLFAKKIILFLLLGSLTAFLGAAIAGNAEISLGTSESEFIIMVFVSFVLFLITGISWLYTAILIKEREEC